LQIQVNLAKLLVYVFAPNSYGRRVWSLAGTNLNVKVKGQGHHGQKGIFRSFRRPACYLCLL